MLRAARGAVKRDTCPRGPAGGERMTFSIVAFLPETGELGVAVATCKPAIGGRVPFVRMGAGAVASQAVGNAWLRAAALALLARGTPARAGPGGAPADDPTPHRPPGALRAARG